MKITKKVLEQAKNGMKAIQNSDYKVYIKMREGNERYIDYIVEKGNYYFLGQNEEGYVYWDGNTYGFTFSGDIFNEKND